MPSDPRSVSAQAPESGLGSLRGCLVEGDAEQQSRERRVRRRALVVSILVQSVILAVLVLVPLFGKTERLVAKEFVPIPPYSPYRGTPRNPGRSQDPTRRQIVRGFFEPTSIPLTIPTRDPQTTGEQTSEEPPDGLVPGRPSLPDGLIPLSDTRRTVARPEESLHHPGPPPRLQKTSLDPAMLVHRVEPTYPPLAIQTHREGRVELRAIIATDGSIQSLQIVRGDLLFYQSAKDAVSQWRYKPTILNGQPVEIDTYITVVYTMKH
jgi:protein TonB